MTCSNPIRRIANDNAWGNGACLRTGNGSGRG